MYERRNRAYWETQADAYQTKHGEFLDATAEAWGIWRIPEANVGALGDVVDRDVLEYGCGAGQWSIALGRKGARPIGLDLSGGQLRQARSGQVRAGVAFPLVLAAAEATPFADASFDIVFCDYGAMTFCDPYATVPEAARLLRSGGTFSFCQATPLRMITDDGDTASRRLHRPYFGMHRFDWDGDTTIDFQLPYGDWIRLFRKHGLLVEDLVELRPPEDAETTFDYYLPAKWARRWPGEQVWRLRRD